MPLRLSFDSGPLAGIHIVTSAQQIRLGRDPGQNDILLTNPKVSRKHAVIERSVRGGYSLEVMGTGPSTLNGDPIAAMQGRPVIHQLANGDRLNFGGIELGVAEAEVKFIVVSGPAVGKEIAIDGPARIGSGSDCDLVINHPSVAPEHVVVTSTPLGFRADAHAPVQFNGAQAESRVLSHGDELILGEIVVRFTVSAPDVDADQPEGSLTNMAVVGRSAAAPTNAVGELIFISGAAKGEKIPLGSDQIILGTRADCTLVLNDLLASPIHCAISMSGDQFVATDLGSEAGTYINGERIFQGTALKPGDLVAIGSHVVEARLIGGVSTASKGNTIFTTIAPGGLDLGPQSKFVVDGRVLKAKKIVLGRAPSCDVIIDGPAVSREHCVIEWENGFICRDTSSAGTYIDDKRIVQQQLQPTCVIRVVDTLFRVAVRGEVCTLERTDAVLAQAAVEVARQNASMLTKGIQIADQGGYQLPTGASQFMTREGMQTIFKLDVGQLEQQIAARKKDIRKGAPAWRPSSDLERNPVMRGTIMISILAALALCGGALFFSGGTALVNHPLSPAHSSAAFTEQVSSKGGGVTPCGACHSAGAKVSDGTCQSCHDGFTMRGHKYSKGGHDGHTCTTCHREHQGDAAGPNDKTLFARAACDGCHPNEEQKSQGIKVQHGDAFKSMGPAPIEAGTIPVGKKPDLEFADAPVEDPAKIDPKRVIDCEAALKKGQKDLKEPGLRTCRLEQFHAAHARVKPQGKGPEIGIGCNACHSNGDAKDPTKLEENTKLGLVCFRCHDKPKEGEPVNCGSCHGAEHPKTLERKPREIVLETPGPVASIGWAAGIAFAGILPGILFGLMVRVRRRKAQEKLVEKLTATEAVVVKRLVHSINDSKCVGCSMCVQACPASVLELVDHKSRVVNFDACIQCKKCEKACAFDALRMHDADKPPPMIPMPSVDAYHETPVQGMYLIGQASGTPQVKNATNLGRACIQRIVQAGFRPGQGRQLGAEYDVVIVGSGPAGLSAALTCVELKLSYVVLEKERELSWTIRNYYHKGKEVMAEPHDIGLEATLPHWDSSREELLGAWEELVQQHNVPIKYLHNCVDVKKNGEVFQVMCGDGKNPPNVTITGARVIIAIGTLGNPRKVGAPGDDLEKVKNSLVDPDEWRGKNILVLGGSDSGVEVVMALSKPELGNKVYHSQRGAKLEGVKPKNLKLMAEALAAGRYEQRYATTITEITPTSVALTHKDDGRREDLPNDVIFAMIGGNSPQKWLQQIGVPYVEKPHSWSPPRTDLLSQKTAEGLVPMGQQIPRLPRRPIPQRDPHH